MNNDKLSFREFETMLHQEDPILVVFSGDREKAKFPAGLFGSKLRPKFLNNFKLLNFSAKASKAILSFLGLEAKPQFIIIKDQKCIQKINPYSLGHSAFEFIAQRSIKKNWHDK